MTRLSLYRGYALRARSGARRGAEPRSSQVLKGYSGNGLLSKKRTAALAVTAECLTDTDGELDEFPFDENNKNDWRKSSLRKYLNGVFTGNRRGQPY